MTTETGGRWFSSCGGLPGFRVALMKTARKYQAWMKKLTRNTTSNILVYRSVCSRMYSNEMRINVKQFWKDFNQNKTKLNTFSGNIFWGTRE